MKFSKNFQKAFSFLALLMSFFSSAQDISVHDPVMIKQKDTYYLYCTGKGISVFSSKDLKNWNKEPAIFPEKPLWVNQVVSDFDNHIWAPDISFHNNMYYLYYSVSAFAKNTSAIGVTINTTLDPKDPAYKWVDQGIVIQSIPNRDLWNAIDPNLTFDENNTPWLAFGSFWEGLKMVKLNSDLISIAQPEEWFTIAKRKRTFELADTDPGDGALEAPFVFKKNDYYYQFLSWDLCCRGEKSTYKVVVGRSKKITGPYVDKEGKLLNEGGGTLLIQGNQNWFGAGHNSTYTFDGKDYIVYHAYDAKQKGRPVLQIKQLQWDADLWPVVESLK
ncbi:arabinan endo-1,5-alpha-L-arabinosidase [Flavobacterium franklandianum]|uniref:Arabinan endo-1,5-alpha-L-arabinosidase n=1 Tax=Flavobacterium franklandianum TaxID=2594430 RepID=A0A553CP60_9FLAO|nr:arabinan endo-1,5-alpha-L-arabinosidase [Flavobacterium franklandianum]TRX22269.1 arabinan endo-1,5-alpha-L-arabinosidase [Flavobacterium franklandianum]